MEKLVEDENKTIEEASNSIEERTRGTIVNRVDLVDSTEECSMGSSNSHMLALEDNDLNESDMEDEEKVLEFFRRNSGLIPEVVERNNFPYLNKSEGMLLQFQENTLVETEQTHVVFHSLIDIDSNETSDLGRLNLNSPEGIKSSSASNDDTEDSSSNSDLDSSLSRYYFDGSLPVSTHVEESPGPRDEKQVCKSKLVASISNNSVVAMAFLIRLIRHNPLHITDTSTVPQATLAATNNFMEELLRNPRASLGC